jgi:hypothetical protein
MSKIDYKDYYFKKCLKSNDDVHCEKCTKAQRKYCHKSSTRDALEEVI